MKKKKKKKDLEDIFETILSVMVGFAFFWWFEPLILTLIDIFIVKIPENSILFNPYFFLGVEVGSFILAIILSLIFERILLSKPRNVNPYKFVLTKDLVNEKLSFLNTNLTNLKYELINTDKLDNGNVSIYNRITNKYNSFILVYETSELSKKNITNLEDYMERFYNDNYPKKKVYTGNYFDPYSYIIHYSKLIIVDKMNEDTQNLVKDSIMNLPEFTYLTAVLDKKESKLYIAKIRTDIGSGDFKMQSKEIKELFDLNKKK